MYFYVHTARLELLENQNSPPDVECLPTPHVAGMQNLYLYYYSVIINMCIVLYLHFNTCTVYMQ